MHRLDVNKAQMGAPFGSLIDKYDTGLVKIV